ncbi:MAG: hypothetical protein A2909_02040 [Candidatus Tagabacteria bacterium RIFCSPLOWO2_01_FULL_39_11]|uniref:Uncharacterized protein n=1 Tax=Candidatus Tagabacteria bacterium RIFCSPLOWO2_01_FULL_39_11 TaxID=1802295 RepID=A0A1G2LS26_9BACT|nr:MAG: hypothetical protein A2909_02040 [Candidatus Tagabacteria bacterium RIFCSPLOWO2_01_FULL_39_11]
MPNNTKQQLLERYQKLPEDLKEAIFSVETTEIIQKISKKYGLLIDKMGELASETGLVMLGATPPREFISNLSRRLEVDRGKAAEIAKDINDGIFSKVRENLKKIHGIAEEPESEEKTGYQETELPKTLPISSPLPPKPPYQQKPPSPPTSVPSIKSVPPPNLPIGVKIEDIKKKESPEEKLKAEQIREIEKETDWQMKKNLPDIEEKSGEMAKETDSALFQGKIRPGISKKPSQTIEIEIPSGREEKNDFPAGYKGDPYKEPLG